ncbi:hypothetical protein FA15DRAFT_645556 [Coprinopsis marcescibilis]|uniref:RNI-like protein n=1 Tax=Coprinopsis marcescibilis TaxID=230819 RepID=A0A5C3KZU0_COPMA|nr:hypothetical protein FA15DRAFT_645556 [Coprinopsis marcescibilis]
MENTRISNPLVDFQNPFYCPALPAATYLRGLRRSRSASDKYRNARSKIPKRRENTGHRSSSLFNAFSRMIDQQTSGDFRGDSDVDVVQYDSENDWIVGRNPRLGKGKASKRSRRALTPVLASPSTIGRSGISGANVASGRVLTLDRMGVFQPPGPHLTMGEENLTGALEFSSRPLQSTVLNRGILGNKRKREKFSDLLCTPRHTKSDPTMQDSDSFEVDVQHETIFYDITSSPALLPTVEPSIEQEKKIQKECESILWRIDAIAPGLRLRRRFTAMNQQEMQDIFDFLADHGLITPGILNVIRISGVTSLSLSASLSEGNSGLNISRHDILRTFGKPNSFECLVELSFSGSSIDDFDLVNIHHLPRLSALYLNGTGIGNEGVFLLVPLKLTLTKLSLAYNPCVTSISVPALILLDRLVFLSLLETSVDIIGLRSLATVAFDEYRGVDIEIPSVCEAYIDNMESMYCVDLKPPLISDPELVSSLAMLALKKNLAAHAERNREIVATGTRGEMVERLKSLLEKRRGDLLVAKMLGG